MIESTVPTDLIRRLRERADHVSHMDGTKDIVLLYREAADKLERVNGVLEEEVELTSSLRAEIARLERAASGPMPVDAAGTLFRVSEPGEAAETITALRAELARLQRQNDLLNEINAAMRGNAPAPVPGPVLASPHATHADEVIAWLRRYIAGRPGRFALIDQLQLAMHNAGFGYWRWFDSPPVLAAGLRLEEREVWEGYRTKVYVMDEGA